MAAATLRYEAGVLSTPPLACWLASRRARGNVRG
jgi:hypothetical protein